MLKREALSAEQCTLLVLCLKSSVGFLGVASELNCCLYEPGAAPDSSSELPPAVSEKDLKTFKKAQEIALKVGWHSLQGEYWALASS